MKKLFLILLAIPAFSATFFIDAGSHSWGSSVKFTLPFQATVTSSTPPSGNGNGFVFSDFLGVLNVVAPPGMTIACTAPGSICESYTASGSGGTINTGSATPSLFYLDAVFNTTNAAGGVALLGNAIPPPAKNDTHAAVASGSAGIRLYPDINGFITGLRFYKVAADTSTSTSIILQTYPAGTVLATATASYSSGAVGWQTAALATPVAVTANTQYAVMLGNGIIAYRINGLQNYAYHNGSLHSIAYYNGGNGACNMTDAFPQIEDGFSGVIPAAGIMGCFYSQTNGLITAFSPGQGFSAGTLQAYRNFGAVYAEGCQCMLGGYGPGPYAGIGTYLEGSGNMWHHDDSGGTFGVRNYNPRGDYYYNRMEWTQPDYTRLGASGSDGKQYYSRQLLEWKGGNRVVIKGSKFGPSANSDQGSSLAISFGNQTAGNSDIDFVSNIVHGTPGWSNIASQYGYTSAPIQARLRVKNNLFVDIGAYGTAGNPSVRTGDSYLIQMGGGAEDFIMDHNTVTPLRGPNASVFWSSNLHVEGAAVTNNIFPIANNDSSGFGDRGETGIPGSTTTGCGVGEANIVNCSSSKWLNYSFVNNLLYPQNSSIYDPVAPDSSGTYIHTYTSTTTASQVAANWPTLKNSNYVGTLTDINQFGWYLAPSATADATSHPAYDMHLKTTSVFRSGTSQLDFSNRRYSSTDGKDIGVDMNQFDADQGVVYMADAPQSSITSTTASVIFAPADNQACYVDYAVYNPSDPNMIQSFTRVTDTATGPVHTVSLTGLTSKTTYMYRVDCEIEQPTGQFVTH